MYSDTQCWCSYRLSDNFSIVVISFKIKGSVKSGSNTRHSDFLKTLMPLLPKQATSPAKGSNGRAKTLAGSRFVTCLIFSLAVASRFQCITVLRFYFYISVPFLCDFPFF